MSKDKEGNWMWYSDQIKSAIGRSMTDLEVKDMFRKYINGVKWDIAILEIK